MRLARGYFALEPAPRTGQSHDEARDTAEEHRDRRPQGAPPRRRRSALRWPVPHRAAGCVARRGCGQALPPGAVNGRADHCRAGKSIGRFERATREKRRTEKPRQCTARLAAPTARRPLDLVVRAHCARSWRRDAPEERDASSAGSSAPRRPLRPRRHCPRRGSRPRSWPAGRRERTGLDRLTAESSEHRNAEHREDAGDHERRALRPTTGRSRGTRRGVRSTRPAPTRAAPSPPSR